MLQFLLWTECVLQHPRDDTKLFKFIVKQIILHQKLATAFLRCWSHYWEETTAWYSIRFCITTISLSTSLYCKIDRVWELSRRWEIATLWNRTLKKLKKRWNLPGIIFFSWLTISQKALLLPYSFISSKITDFFTQTQDHKTPDCHLQNSTKPKPHSNSIIWANFFI